MARVSGLPLRSLAGEERISRKVGATYMWNDTKELDDLSLFDIGLWVAGVLG